MTRQSTPRGARRALARLPADLRPCDAATGHAIQVHLPRVAGAPVVGWKIAATSAAGQAHIGVGGPLAGRILDRFVEPVGTSLSLAGNRMRVVEPEFAFRMATALPSPGIVVVKLQTSPLCVAAPSNSSTRQ